MKRRSLLQSAAALLGIGAAGIAAKPFTVRDEGNTTRLSSLWDGRLQADYVLRIPRVHPPMMHANIEYRTAQRNGRWSFGQKERHES